MPELPEVETVVNSLAPHIRNRSISSLEILRPSTLHPLSMPADSVVNYSIDRLRRRGKLILMDISPSGNEGSPPSLMVIIHLRMTGRLLTDSADQGQKKHIRAIFNLVDDNDRFFKLYFDDTRAFGQILIADAEILDKWQFWRDLGPEPFELDPPALKIRLKGSRNLKSTLLDQKIIAGLGNIYVDEALFEAGILPYRTAESVSAHESELLLAAIHKKLKTAIQKKGSSIRDYRDANGETGAFQKEFAVYGRAGKECLNCGQTLQKIKISGRTTVFCAHCQH